MGDIYAFVRKMTNHELISAQDAKALTDAVDGLIDEIDSRQMRINELNETNSALKAENERLRNMLNGYGKLDAELAIAERRIEALSRTGAVKVGYANSTAPGNPFVTPATEAQQEPAAFRWRNTIDPTIWNVGFAHQAPSYAELEPLYTRPSEQAVTKEMVEAAANSIANIWCTGDLKAIARAALKAAMEASDD